MNETHAPQLRADGGAPPPRLPERIGRYRITGLLGRGGMGVVYLAQQEQPQRPVALKVLRADLQSPELLRRFEYEGQVLGWLQHPGIARIYEAGTAETDAGPQPFFAMELVEGEPLTEYARAQGLSVRERLELMVPVCEAVHHAHQKGVVHRDLKPGNILVDHEGQPRILDFGVARVTQKDLAVSTMHTQPSQMVGTLLYMSPEQVAGDPRELDARSDVYALGVIAYELLAGCLPYEFAGKSLPEAARIISEGDPVRIGSRDRSLRGDVEAILTKALEKDTRRRYPSAHDLASDIERFLSDQPVTARPVTTFYQLGKFTRRNKVLVGSVAAVFLILVVSLVQVTADRNRAHLAEEQAAQEALLAQRESARAKTINGFLLRMLGSAHPEESRGRPITLLEGVDEAARNVGIEFAEQPLVEVDIRGTLGRVYLGLSRHEEAREQLELAALRARAELPPSHPSTLMVLSDLARVESRLGNWETVQDLCQQVLAAVDESDDLDEASRLNAMSILANSFGAQGDWEQARELHEVLVTAFERLHGDDADETLAARNNLALALQNLGELQEARSLFEHTLEQERRMLGPDSPRTLTTMQNLASTLAGLDRLEEAEALLQEALEGCRTVLGPDHDDTVMVQNNLADVWGHQGRHAEAQRLYEELLEINVAKYGEEHHRSIATLNNLATVLKHQGKLDEAEPIHRRSVAIAERVFGLDHPNTLIAKLNLAGLLRRQARFEEAEPLFATIVAQGETAFPPGHWIQGNTKMGHGMTLLALHEHARAEPLLLDGYEAMRSTFGPSHPNTRQAIENLVALYRAWGKPEQAAAYDALL